MPIERDSIDPHDLRRLIAAQEWCNGGMLQAMDDSPAQGTALLAELQDLGVSEIEIDRLQGLSRLQHRLTSVVIERVVYAPPSPQVQLFHGRLLRTWAPVLIATAPWSDPAQLRRFQRDQLLLRALAHPCIATLEDAGEVGGVCWAAYALPAGLPLDPGQRRSEIESLTLVSQFAAGLAALTAAGMTQRYAQPAHLWLDGAQNADSQAQVVDLGLFRGLCGRQRQLAMEDTAWAAPELLQGLALDERSLLYNAAAVLHHLLAGVPPPGRGTLGDDLLTATDRADLSALPYTLEPATTALLAQALRGDPSARYPSLAAFQEALGAALRDSMVAAYDAKTVGEDPFSAADAAADAAAEAEAAATLASAATDIGEELERAPAPADITSRILAKHAQMKASGSIRSARPAADATPQSVIIEPFTATAAPGLEEVLEVVESHGWLAGDDGARERLQNLLRSYLSQSPGGSLPADVVQRLEASRLLSPEQASALEVVLADQRLIRRYRLGQLLEEGASVHRYRADGGAQGPLQLLVLRIGSHGRRNRFLREAPLVAELRHPRLAQLLEADAAGEVCWTVSRAPLEDSLQLRLRYGRAPEAWSIRILQQVAEGLAHLHQRTGLPHLALHPGCVQLAQRPADGPEFPAGEHALLTELGIAALAPWRDCAAPYAAPELLSGADGDLRCDIWSVGALLYRMVLGSMPSHVGVQAGLPDAGLHPQIVELLQRTLAPDPAQRYLDHQVLFAALARAGRELTQSWSPGPSESHGAHEQSTRWERRRELRPSGRMRIAGTAGHAHGAAPPAGDQPPEGHPGV